MSQLSPEEREQFLASQVSDLSDSCDRLAEENNELLIRNATLSRRVTALEAQIARLTSAIAPTQEVTASPATPVSTARCPGEPVLTKPTSPHDSMADVLGFPKEGR